ncbi:MAG TPA: hypothetical protein VEB65_00195 [Solirubrobacterales bacterium]|nr:hypothetical protein [Solirubrobacterales bacterium]
MNVGGMPDPDRFGRRVAAREINGRKVNEAIERGEPDADGASFVCECGYLGCTETVGLSSAAYEDVRSSFDRFLIVPGHEIEEVDEVVERHQEYFVVVKREGEPREMARASDERTP